MASYEEINYSLRPAKQIERKMLCEAMKRLSEFGTIESYRYVGFGSIYFTDFAMIHRQLGISNMISIEKDGDKRVRFEFNKPFDCIELMFDYSSVVLPRLDWQHRSILWLDYDGRLDGDVLKDIGSFCANAMSGSMLIITVNVNFGATEGDRLVKLRDVIGKDLIPIDLAEKDLAGWNAASSIRRIITNAVEWHVKERNGLRRPENRFTWKQVFSFDYADGAKMTTIGGVLVEDGHRLHFEKCGFGMLEFVRTNPKESYHIEVPALTNRELRYLDQQFPSGDHSAIEAYGIPSADVQKYGRVYRYFPTFAEAQF